VHGYIVNQGGTADKIFYSSLAEVFALSGLFLCLTDTCGGAE